MRVIVQSDFVPVSRLPTEAAGAIVGYLRRGTAVEIAATPQRTTEHTRDQRIPREWVRVDIVPGTGGAAFDITPSATGMQVSPSRTRTAQLPSGSFWAVFLRYGKQTFAPPPPVVHYIPSAPPIVIPPPRRRGISGLAAVGIALAGATTGFAFSRWGADDR